MSREYTREEAIKFVKSAWKHNIGPFIIEKYEDVFNKYGKDMEIVSEALVNDIRTLKYIPSDFKSNITCILDLSKRLGGCALSLASDEIKNNPKAVITLVALSNMYPREIRRGQVIDRIHYNAFQYASIDVKKDYKTSLTAIELDSESIKYVDESLLNDESFLANCLLVNDKSASYMDEQQIDIAKQNLLEHNLLTNELNSIIENRLDAIAKEASRKKAPRETKDKGRMVKTVASSGYNRRSSGGYVRDQYGGVHTSSTVSGNRAIPGQNTTNRR